MIVSTEQIKDKLQSAITWYNAGQHGCSERFNDGRLSALHEIETFIREREEACCEASLIDKERGHSVNCELPKEAK